MLNYQVDGRGYPIVFLHGFLESNSMWKYLGLQDLNAQLIFIDLPGHGNSSLCKALPPSIETMTSCVLEIIDHLSIEKFSLVGHSMGGYVALEMKNYSDNVDKVVLLNSNTWSDSSQKVIDRQRVASIAYQAKDLFLNEAIPNLFLDPVKHHKEVKDLINEAKSIEPDAIAYASLAMSTRTDYTKHVLENRENYFIIQGEGDKIVPRDAMDKLFAENSMHYFVVSDAGHMVHIEQSAQVLTILKSIFCQ